MNRLWKELRKDARNYSKKADFDAFQAKILNSTF